MGPMRDLFVLDRLLTESFVADSYEATETAAQPNGPFDGRSRE